MAKHKYQPYEVEKGWIGATCRCGLWWTKEAAPLNADLDEVFGMLMTAWQHHVMVEANKP